MSYVAGIDLGGSSVKAVAITPEGEVLHQASAAFDPATRLAFAEGVRSMLRRIQAEAGEELLAVGVSAPGLVARDERSIAYMPGRLEGLERLDWTEFLGLPRPVPVLNDAQAALLGEVWLGAAQGATHAVLLTLGTGVGGAAIVDGHLLRGAIGRAGHLGHICLNPDGELDICGTPGSLEQAIGNATLPERSGGRFTTTHDLVEAVRAGDANAREVWGLSVRALGCGIASLVNVLDPEVVILGGGIARAGEVLFDRLREVLEVVEWRPGGHRVKVVPAKLGEYAGAIGSAWNALDLE